MRKYYGTYRSTYLLVCLHTYHPTYLPTDLPPCLIYVLTNISTYLFMYLPVWIRTYQLTYLPISCIIIFFAFFCFVLFFGFWVFCRCLVTRGTRRGPRYLYVLVEGFWFCLFECQRCFCCCCCCSCSCCCAWSRGFVCLLLQCSPSSHTAAWPRRLPILVAFHSRWLNNKLLLLSYCSGIISIISYCVNVTRLLLLLRLGCLRLLLLLFFFRCNLSLLLLWLIRSFLLLDLTGLLLVYIFYLLLWWTTRNSIG